MDGTDSNSPSPDGSAHCVCAALSGERTDLTTACLGGLWLFADLTPPELRAVMGKAWRGRYDRGQFIFLKGEPARLMFLIKAGRVKLGKVSGGNEVTLDIRQAGDLIGLNVLTDLNETYPLTATCLEETVVCGLTREGFEGLVLEHPTIGLQVIRNLSTRLAGLGERVESMALGNLEERLYAVLLQFAREHGVVRRDGVALQFPLTHEELGFLVGAHRVSITRAMKSLSGAGKIRRQGNTLVLTRFPFA
jgi:CRP/FNR family cyclic AMP-dependent transcriptional regulator